MASSTKRRRGRAIATAVVCLALAGAAAVGLAVRTPKSSSTIETPSIFKTAAVSTGDLTTTERIDGIVQLSSTLPVLHRIEGQTSSSSNSTSTPSTPSTTTPDGNNSSSPNALSSTLVADDCPSTTMPTTPQEPTTTTAPADTVPVTPSANPPTTPPVTPAGTTLDTTPVATSTVAPVAPVTEPPPVTAPPVATCDTTTTTAPGAAATTVPGDTTGNEVGGPTGNSRTGATGPTGASNGSTGSTESTARVTQTITSIIGVNTTIQQGDVLYTVDGAPVVALDGALPAWRSLSTTSDDGADIAQLETSLVALGYDPDLLVTVDNHFDSATRTMVKAWQQGLGVETTGTVALGSVVFLPSSTTVSAVDQAVGDTVGDGDTVLTLAAPTQEVLVDVPAGDEAQVVPGLTVDIGNVQGTVSRLRSADRDGSVVVEAVITPATAIENATNGSSVIVTLTLQNDSGVLIAPAEALVSRLDGSYAVQVQDSDGTAKWATVELLGVSGVNVAIRGVDVAEGTVLLLPA
jgi:Putative peptidoglycan binding domain